MQLAAPACHQHAQNPAASYHTACHTVIGGSRSQTSQRPHTEAPHSIFCRYRCLCLSSALRPTSRPADIQPGQGLLYETLTKTWRAQNCIKNNYGLSAITYGLTPAPCKDCPNYMVATTDAAFPSSVKYFTWNADGTGGFISPFACVTTAGESGIVAFLQLVRASGWSKESC